VRYPKRLIEVDLPIARISTHARREKSIRHGHISTLHIWWARRPLAACRAVICAALWPDPEDLTRFVSPQRAQGDTEEMQNDSNPLRTSASSAVNPSRFLNEARQRMLKWATQYAAKSSNESLPRITAIQRDAAVLDDPVKLRGVLLDFIADFANWDNSTDPAYLETARALTQAAHEALGGLPAGQAGEPGTRPLVVDPFAGGGSIPLEALRVGADAFASDLNPIPVLLNKVVLEYIPKYGQRLADEVRKWGQWIKEQAEKELAEFYPPDLYGRPRTPAPPNGSFYAYVIRCADGSFYKGHTDNLERRVTEHERGEIEHTRKHRPLELWYYEEFKTRDEAIAREKYFKSGSGREWLVGRFAETEATPIAYLWARTILSEAPADSAQDDGPGPACRQAGETPVEVPLMRSLWLAKKAGRKRALRWVRLPAGEAGDEKTGKVKTQTVEVAYREDGQPVARKVKRPLLEIFEPKKDSEVEGGTVARGSATCPVTGFTTKVDSVRAQLKKRRGGAADARLFCVVTTWAAEQGRFYRLPTKADQTAFDAAAAELERREKGDGTSRSQAGRRSAEAPDIRRSLVPDEVISLNELRRVSVPIYGMERWGDLFSPRQALALTTLARLVRESGEQMRASTPPDPGMAEAVATCLALVLRRQANACTSLSRVDITRDTVQGLYARQAVGMVWDFVEVNPFSGFSGDWDGALAWVFEVCEANCSTARTIGHVEQSSATGHPLPDDAANAIVTDPPYYDAVPYAYLSDFFYVWMRRTLADVHPALFREAGVPKDAEIVVDRPHQLSKSTKDIAFYERELTRAFAEGRRVLRPDGVATIVFASKTTASWEAILKAVIDAGFVITGSWPIDTEMETRVAAQGQARLGSSVHIACRPREDPSGALREGDVGDWRDVLAELPKRIHDWMPRLTAEGVVGADAIFACLGPALEVFSRYSRVEKASGEVVTLGEYLEQVWAVVSKEALSLLFSDADAAGLEPDARLTAMWLWTLGAGRPTAEDAEERGGEEDEDKDGEEESSDHPSLRTSASSAVKSGFVLEFDAARKIAQGLGAHLDKLPTVVEVKGDKARLLSVAERTGYLFAAPAGGQGKDQGQAPAGRRKKKDKQLKLDFAAKLEQAEEAEGGWASPAGGQGVTGAAPGATVLDRVHQAMILFAAGRSEALRRFLVEDGAGKDARFWKLADNLSKLYPSKSDEKRWVDGVLGRKKGLGL
jgi:adenine-specific DNA methylase/predicted GIY-YIG superfamily endonuclease